MYKEWQKMSAPPAKKIKLDEAAATQEPLVSNLIAKLSDEPFDKEYATFLNDKSPVLKIMTKRGWTKSVGLGKKGRKGNLRVASSVHFTFMIYGDKTIVIKIVKSRHPQSDQGHSS